MVRIIIGIFLLYPPEYYKYFLINKYYISVCYLYITMMRCKISGKISRWELQWDLKIEYTSNIPLDILELQTSQCYNLQSELNDCETRDDNETVKSKFTRQRDKRQTVNIQLWRFNSTQWKWIYRWWNTKSRWWKEK